MHVPVWEYFGQGMNLQGLLHHVLIVHTCMEEYTGHMYLYDSVLGMCTNKSVVEDTCIGAECACVDSDHV